MLNKTKIFNILLIFILILSGCTKSNLKNKKTNNININKINIKKSIEFNNYKVYGNFFLLINQIQ